MLELKNIEVVYNEVVLVIKGLSLKVEQGEIVSLLGANGAGKSTTLKAVSSLLKNEDGEVTRGNIYFLGKEITNSNPSEIVKKGLFQVMEGRRCIADMTVQENLRLGAHTRSDRKNISRDMEKVLNYFPRLRERKGLSGYLSGGEQQRVALARALATSPGLLLLDEPLSALDAKVRVFLRKQIRDLQRKLGVTTIMVTHDQEEAQTMADRIFVMNEGEIIQSGTPSEIYTKANSPFIASFIGSMNFIPATIDSSKKVKCKSIEINCDPGSFNENDSVQLAVRPEEIYFQQENQDDNVVLATIKEIEFLGSFQRVYFEAVNLTDDLIIVDVPSISARKIKLNIDEEMNLYFSKQDARIYST